MKRARPNRLHLRRETITALREVSGGQVVTSTVCTNRDCIDDPSGGVASGTISGNTAHNQSAQVC